MSEACGNLPVCGFFKKYSATDKAACQGCIKTYCKGPRRELCEREVYRATYNSAPPDEMMPSGAMAA